MINLKATLVLAFGAALAGNAESASSDQPHVWQVLGTGQLHCGKWTIARENKDEVQVELFKQWLVGWIASYNYYEGERGSKRFVSQPDFDTSTAYLDKFCADKPLTIVALGAAQLIEDLGGAKALHNRKRSK